MRFLGAWLPVVLVAAIAGVATISFAVGDVTSSCLPWQDRVEAHLAIDRVDVRNGQVDVSGTTDLPDGAVLGYFFLHESELGDVTRSPRYQAGGEARVERGRYALSEDLAGWPDGDAVMEVWFQVGEDMPQPDEIVEAFGSQGQCLSGPQVGVDSPGDPKVLHADARVTLPGNTD